MVVPVREQAAQQVWPAQKGRVRGRGTPEHEVIAATRSGMATIDHELLGNQAALMGSVVQMKRAIGKLFPRFRRMNIYLDDTWVRRHAEMIEAWIFRRFVAFQDNRL